MSAKRGAIILLVGLYVILSIFSIAEGRDQASLAGRWQGYIDIIQAKLEIIIEFERVSGGTWKGTIDIPAQMARGLALSEIEYTREKVSFRLPDVPGEARFEGRLAEDGKSLSGDFFQSGQRFIFTLTREDATQAGQRKAQLQDKKSKIIAFADSMMRVWDAPGFAFAVVKDGKVFISEGLGFRNLADSLPVTSKTLFAIGSTTKAFTALALGMLADEGKLDWEEKVISYLPDFRLKDDYATLHMTPLDLLTHRCGLPRHDLLWYGSLLNREEIFSRLQYLEPSQELRMKYQYSNLMYLCAGILVEELSGMSWEDFIQQRILVPLGMERTNLSVEVSKTSDDYALPYEKSGNAGAVAIPFRSADNIAPAGAINSSLEDMCKWISFNLNKGESEGIRLISEVEMQRIFTPHMVMEPAEYPEFSFLGYGLGWIIQHYRGHQLIWHNGGIDGFYTLLLLFPNDDLGLVAFVNTLGLPIAEIVSYYAADLMLDLEPIDWNLRYQQKSAGGATGEEQTRMSRVEGTRPSHDLADYAGDYEHPGYGVIKIVVADKKLRALYQSFELDFEHWHYDVFSCQSRQWAGNMIQFFGNKQGDIDRLALPLEPTVDDIVFIKKADARLFDPQFLQKLTGKYQLDQIITTVELRGDRTLFVIVPGQPPYELVPYLGTEFKLKDLKGYSLRFKLDAKGETAVEMSFIQPNGVFTAKKK